MRGKKELVLISFRCRASEGSSTRMREDQCYERRNSGAHLSARCNGGTLPFKVEASL